MPKFLNTTATSYHLEELVKNAKEKLILISPFLRLNERIKELLEDKNRLKIDVRIVYGKSELQPDEIRWLSELDYIRTSFCKNLHAKCYLNENHCIITSLNLYEFSQINNNEMGILLRKDEDIETYKEASEEAQRLIRISEEIRISAKVVENEEVSYEDESTTSMLTSYKLALKLGMRTSELIQLLTKDKYIEEVDGINKLTAKGEKAGGESKKNKHGQYFLWPENFKI